MVESTHRELIVKEAAEWLLRLRQPGNGAATNAEFNDWLTSSPACIEEYLAMTLAWEALEAPPAGGLSTEALIAAARAEHEVAGVATLPRRVPSRRASARIPLALRAMAAVVLLIVGWLAWQHRPAPPLYATTAQQERTVTLADGSSVALAPSSAIEVYWTAAERRVALDYGRARFQDVDDPRRPFIVVTAHGVVQAVGTVFDVDTDRTDTKLDVIDGRVEVGTRGPDGDSLILAAGDHAILWGTAATGDGAPSMSVMAWTASRLVVRRVPLGAVLEQFNGAAAGRYVFDSPSLAALTISGVFDPRDAAPLLRYLQLYEGLRTQRSPDGIVHLSANLPARR